MDMEGDMKCCARTPCCSKVGLNRGPWSPDEDQLLSKYIQTFGEGRWRTLPKKAGLKRCGKSCRLRWMNYLRPDVKRGYISPEEEDLILRLHRLLGNRWSLIAGRIPGRTDNEIKNYWNTHLKKKLLSQGIDPKTHKAIPPERLALSEIHKPQKSAKIVSTKAANAKQENLIANHNHEMFMLMQQRDKLLPVFTHSTQNLKLPSTGFGSMVNDGNFYHRQKPVVTRTTLDGEFNSMKQNSTDPYNQSLIVKHDLKPAIHQQDHYQNPATSLPPLLLHEMYTSASETTRPRNSSTSCFNPLMSFNNFSSDTLAKHDHIAAFDNTGHNYDGNNTTLQSDDNALGFFEGIKHCGSGVSCSSSATQVSSDHMFLQRWQHLHKSASENLAPCETNNMMMMMMSNEKLTAPSLELSHSNHGYLYPGVLLNNSVPIPSAFSAFSSPGSPSSRLLPPANLICDPSWVASNNHPNA